MAHRNGSSTGAWASQPSQSPDTSHANDIQTRDGTPTDNARPYQRPGGGGFEPTASSSPNPACGANAAWQCRGLREGYVRTLGVWSARPAVGTPQGAGIGRAKGIFVCGAVRTYRIGQERRDKPLALLR